MRAFASLATAMAKGFFRDKMAVFFAILFPLMFLVLFGGLLTDIGTSKSEVIQVGSVALFDRAPPQAKEALAETLTVTKSEDKEAALAKVRTGDADAAVIQSGDSISVFYSRADGIAAATVRGVFQGIVQSANVAATGQEPKFDLSAQPVEDESLTAIQFVTPGLLGWAIAMGATFGAATNLVAWRKNGLLRRLRLAPINTSSVVFARVVVSIVVATVQAAIFVGLGMAVFGLQLTGSWYMMIPLLLAGTLAFMAIGLLAGSVAKTEEGAVGLANFIILPMAFLSGSFFPLDGTPEWLQTVSNLLPLKHLNDGMLATMVRGEGPSAAVVPILILLGFTVVLTAASAKAFRWEAS